ncbi:hypothetical protein H0E84_00380 [Luteimonas sp. SJ-92]|uniref:Uncharacterized protein n=1 Tax=Luteimonas salinisoli TaxID=2752307 RepID=A0A853J714_9GAMM|nr:hypothetical protein [Luteimonas salinisoli]NZA24831.1 hypothetical protein [Luteimonas salinisoli]
MRAIDFIYYCCYRWSEKVNGKLYPNKYSASLMVAFIVMLNLGTLLSVGVTFLGLDVLSIPAGRVGAGLFSVAILAVVYGYFSFGGRYLRVLNRFGSSNGWGTKPGTVVALALGISLALLFSTWIVLS